MGRKVLLVDIERELEKDSEEPYYEALDNLVQDIDEWKRMTSAHAQVTAGNEIVAEYRYNGSKATYKAWRVYIEFENDADLALYKLTINECPPAKCLTHTNDNRYRFVFPPPNRLSDPLGTASL